ncbi:helix-hairpin-helix domain-containing protein [Haloarculaceae archaeon H-GB2-1]|nr:helix-hairpin-helix domain-containing protein [Haloarculaceae archaeon H-GB1-1]MEA5386299.1 helix-hairpin-helix domain-containing protein [Haloarculaceae archaeon H-GB11]MEA5407803.1 helix-hairpin-helix domain-containing protein [Haloarculaceae archaeon H-GB2-1]
MGLIERLKSALGLGSASSRDGSRSERSDASTVGVRVEHEPDTEPDTASEDAVKGTETSDTDTTDRERDAGDAESDRVVSASAPESGGGAVAETESSSSDDSESATAEPTSATDDSDTATKPDDSEETGSDAEPEETEPTGEHDTTEGSAAAADGTPTDSIKGIGPTYADRLAELGIDTVQDLAEADPERIASEGDIAEKRVLNWVERARNR